MQTYLKRFRVLYTLLLAVLFTVPPLSAVFYTGPSFADTSSGHMPVVSSTNEQLIEWDQGLNLEDNSDFMEAIAFPYDRLVYILLLVASLILIIWQMKRTIHRDQRLRTSNKALEKANVRLHELDKLKSDFVSHVSHDLRTPITAIKRIVENLLQGVGGPLSEKQEHSLFRVVVNTKRLTRLIDDLLDLSRIEAGQIKMLRSAIDLVFVGKDVLETMAPIAAAKQIILLLSADESSYSVWADPDRVHQILTNLVTNAINYTPGNGKITLTLTRDDSFCYVAVQDEGGGIPEEELGRIFEAFHQVGDIRIPRDGVGLGLTIARRLVELQDGRIDMESTLGKGSIFRVALPIHEKS